MMLMFTLGITLALWCSSPVEAVQSYTTLQAYDNGMEEVTMPAFIGYCYMDCRDVTVDQAEEKIRAFATGGNDQDATVSVGLPCLSVINAGTGQEVVHCLTAPQSDATPTLTSDSDVHIQQFWRPANNFYIMDVTGSTASVAQDFSTFDVKISANGLTDTVEHDHQLVVKYSDKSLIAYVKLD